MTEYDLDGNGKSVEKQSLREKRYAEINHKYNDTMKHAIALYYTKGDEENADNMVRGEHDDLHIIKIKFSAPDGYGSFILFINRLFLELQNLYCVITTSYEADDIKHTVPWLEFEESISEAFNLEGINEMQIINMGQIIHDACTPSFVDEMINFITIEDREALAYLIDRIIIKKFGLIKTKVQADFETTSSLEMELLSMFSVKLEPEEFEKTQETEEDTMGLELEQSTGDISAEGIIPDSDETVGILEEELPEEIIDISNEFDATYVRHVFKGDLVLSPIKGMHISGLVVKDKIKIKLSVKSETTVRIAQAFNAYKDGKMQSIIGEIVSFRRKPKGGYKIFLSIAEGIVVKIDEDEENIKVEFVEASPERPPELQVDIEKYVNKVAEGKSIREFRSSSGTGKTSKGTGEIGKTEKIIIAVFVVVIVFLMIVIVKFLV